MTPPFTRVTLRDDAMADLRRLAERSQATLLEVFRFLKSLAAGALGAFAGSLSGRRVAGAIGV